MFKLFFRNKHNLIKFKDSFSLENVIESINIDEVNYNNQIRKHQFNINDFSRMIAKYKSGDVSLKEEIAKALKSLPNFVSKTTPIGEEKDSRILNVFQPNQKSSGIHVEKCGELLSQLRVNNVLHGAESRAYYFVGDFARLERALIRYTLNTLMKHGFKLISVPDVITTDMVDRAGFTIDPNKNQIYNVITGDEEIRKLFYSSQMDIDSYKYCLAGTSEMALASSIKDIVFEAEELPLKLCAVSRCYRREVSALESHLYRVHQFNKVEMFCASTSDFSENMLNYIVEIQEELFSKFGIGYRVLNMASEELGKPAYQKIDIEAWMPGENKYGEISSASNCTDYQSKRFNIVYKDVDCSYRFAHTLNGTACAVPRMLKAIVESNQTEDGLVKVPEVLQKYMGGVEIIRRQHPPHRVKWIDKLVPKRD